MKKKTSITKLVLSKKTVTDLNSRDLETAKGGYQTDPRYCSWVCSYECGTLYEFTCKC